MSKLISGKEALIALANGETVEMTDSEVDMPWTEICVKNNDFFGRVEPCPWMFINTPEHIQFRLKPRTITINGIEVPAPFEPKDDYEKENSYVITLGGEKFHWRAPSDYKQVVSALRSVFKPQ